MNHNDLNDNTYFYITTFQEFSDREVSYDDLTAAYSMYYNLKQNIFQMVHVAFREQFEKDHNIIFEEIELYIKRNKDSLVKKLIKK